MSQFIVFFSFKGGVGRSSTLINAARALAKKGKDVVVVDLDIAAPGLDIFEGTDLKETKREQDLKGREYKPCKGCYPPLTKGVTEYLSKGIEQIEKKEHLHFPRMLSEKKDDGDTDKEQTKESYVYRFYKIHEDEDTKEFWRETDPTEGKLYIFRAGHHEEERYFDDQRKLDSAIGEINDTINRYRSLDTENGKTDDANRSEDEGEKYQDMLKSFKEAIDDQLKPDYVLIDARPGISSISLMALQKLAEVVVLCFNLNPWNFESIGKVYKKLTGEWKEKNYIMSELQKILLVITPIPRYAFQYEIYKKQKEKIQVEMKDAINSGGDKEYQPIEVPYNEQMTLKDSLIADDTSFEDDATYHAYVNLADMLIRINPDDIENKIRKAREGMNIEETIKELERLSRTNMGRNKVQVLHAYGKFLLEVGRYRDAIDPLNNAIEESKGMLEPATKSEDPVEYAGNSDIYYLSGLAYLNMCRDAEYRRKISTEALISYLKAAQDRFTEAERGKRDDIALMAEGDALLEKARIDIDSTNKILMEARDKYNAAIDANKGVEAEYHFKSGKVNAVIAGKLDDDKEIMKFRSEANGNFKEAIARRADYSQAYFEWGRNLYYESDFLKNEDGGKYKDKKLEEANDKFGEAIKNRRDYAESFYLWALSTSKMSGGSVEKINKIIDEAKSRGESAEIEALIASYKIKSAVEKNLEERADILNRACIDFGRGTTYKKDFKEAYFFWGAALFVLHKQKRLLKEEEEERLYFRDAFYKLEQAIALFFDYPGFYFDPNEIDEIEKNTYTCVYALESMFNGNKTYTEVKKRAGMPDDFESLFEPQFKSWLNRKELEELEGAEKKCMEYYEKVILKAVFKDFMTEDEREEFEPLDEVLKEKPIREMLNFIKTIAERELPEVPVWKKRKQSEDG